MKVILNILAGGGGLLLATIPLEKVGVVYLDSLHKVNLYVKEKIHALVLYVSFFTGKSIVQSSCLIRRKSERWCDALKHCTGCLC